MFGFQFGFGSSNSVCIRVSTLPSPNPQKNYPLFMTKPPYKFESCLRHSFQAIHLQDIGFSCNPAWVCFCCFVYICLLGRLVSHFCRHETTNSFIFVYMHSFLFGLSWHNHRMLEIIGFFFRFLRKLSLRLIPSL